MADSSRSIFLSAYVGMLLFGISLTTLGSVAPALAEKITMSGTSFGTLFSILPLGILSGSLLFGPFADRYGYKVIFTLAGASMFAGFQGIAFSTSITILNVSVFGFGLGGGALNGGTNAVVSDISEGNRSASLSILGVFFAVGALGMPFILGLLQQQFAFETIVSAIGYLALFGTGLFVFTGFPKAKQENGVAWPQVRKLFNDSLLLLIGFFLFCQSSFEAVINNWTTTYLLDKFSLPMSSALYALSMYVAGMAAMRLVLGKILRHVSAAIVVYASLVLLVTGAILLHLSSTYELATVGLVIIGVGLAAGFPVMLGIAGDRYAAVSGTAFSLVISIGLVGSMIINYLMGLAVEYYGIRQLVTMAVALTLFMLLFSIKIIKKTSLKTN